jgi:hypothetical protein
MCRRFRSGSRVWWACCISSFAPGARLTLSETLARRCRGTLPGRNSDEVTSFVDAKHLDLSTGDINLVDTARLLREASICRQRLIEKLQQRSSVDAVVSDEHNRVVRMTPDGQTQCISAPRNRVLEGLAIGKTHEMRAREPQSELVRLAPLDLVLSFPLPRAMDLSC